MVPVKVRKTARIRNRIPHMSQDTKWESNKITINITNKSQEVSPFPSGDHTAAMTDAKACQTQDISNTNDPQKKYSLKVLVLLSKLKVFNFNFTGQTPQYVSFIANLLILIRPVN